MAKSNQQLNKRERREQAIKRAKRKKIIIISAIAAVVVALVSYLIVNAILAPETDIFTDGSQTVILQSDGNFTANLSHSVKRDGTFTLADQEELTIVTFNQNGAIFTAEIENDELILPEEWKDECGHNWILPKR